MRSVLEEIGTLQLERRSLDRFIKKGLPLNECFQQLCVVFAEHEQWLAKNMNGADARWAFIAQKLNETLARVNKKATRFNAKEVEEMMDSAKKFFNRMFTDVKKRCGTGASFSADDAAAVQLGINAAAAFGDFKHFWKVLGDHPTYGFSAEGAAGAAAGGAALPAPQPTARRSPAPAAHLGRGARVHQPPRPRGAPRPPIARARRPRRVSARAAAAAPHHRAPRAAAARETREHVCW